MNESASAFVFIDYNFIFLDKSIVFVKFSDFRLLENLLVECLEYDLTIFRKYHCLPICISDKNFMISVTCKQKPEFHETYAQNLNARHL